MNDDRATSSRRLFGLSQLNRGHFDGRRLFDLRFAGFLRGVSSGLFGKQLRQLRDAIVDVDNDNAIASHTHRRGLLDAAVFVRLGLGFRLSCNWSACISSFCRFGISFGLLFLLAMSQHARRLGKAHEEEHTERGIMSEQADGRKRNNGGRVRIQR